MKAQKTALGRMAIGAGALALAFAGLATGANAAPVPIDSGNGTLTIHKHVLDSDSTPGNPAGAALEGVEFTIQQVGELVGGVCTAPNLATTEGWDFVDDVNDAMNDGDPLPSNACLLGTAVSQSTSALGVTTFNTLRGLYYVTETDPGDNLVATPAAPFVVTVPMPVAADGTWEFDVHAYPKNVLADPDGPVKKVDSISGNGVGATINWTITVPVAALPLPYNEVKVSDSVGADLTFEEFTSVKLDGVELDGPTATTPDYTISGSTITLTAAGLAKVNAITSGDDGEDAEITVGVKTTIASLSADGKIENDASATLNGNTKSTTDDPDVPGGPGGGVTPAYVWGELEVLKHESGDTSEVLSGATFQVYETTGAAGSETCSPLGAAVTGATGSTNASGLWSTPLHIANVDDEADAVGLEKKYCLVETAAPSGFVLDKAPKLVTVAQGEATTASFEFANVKVNGPDLPFTGAQATLMFTVGGALLMVVGAGAVVASRRKRQLL